MIPGISCFNHRSDWEGVTVVVDRTEDADGRSTPRPISVHYAAHAHVTRYSWAQLRRHWATRAFAVFTRKITDAAERPLVFIARGTHAAYPTPCPGPLRRTPCRQVAGDLEENPADGRLGWSGNHTLDCAEGSSCLRLLPTRVGGAEPALWNAFDGPWGEAHCILTFYCDSISPPAAPGQQGRYRQPARYNGRGDLENARRPYKKVTSFDE